MVQFGGDELQLFDGISKNQLEDIMSKGVTVLAKKNDELYKKGFIGIIKSGTATVIRTGTGGNSITVRNMLSGDTFGAASLFGEWNESFSSIKAEDRCEVLYFSERDFKELICKYNQLAVNYICFLSDRIRFLNRRLDTFCAGTTQNKLYEFLISQADQNGETQIKISMSELANRLGIGRTSLYRDISSLEKANLIKRNGKKIIII